MKGKGILIGEDGDLKVRPQRDGNGVIVAGLLIGNTVSQNQYILLRAYPGELKEHPALGVGVADLVNDNDISGWSNEIRMQLEKDGMKVSKVKFGRDMNLEIDAEYGDE